MKKNTQRSRRKPRASRVPNPPPSMISYKGPISIPVADTTTVVLVDSGTIATAMAAVTILATFNNNPSNARNWTEYSTSWAEYRVLGIKFSYFPVTNTPNGVLLAGSGFTSIFHGTSVAPTSLAEASSTGVSRSFNVFKPFVRTWRMCDINEATYTLTSAPASTSDTLVVYATNVIPGATTFGNVQIEYLVQFKTHTK